MIKRPIVPTKALTSAIGKVISMSMALGPVAWLMTRSLYIVLNTRKSWCSQLELSAEARNELEFWSLKMGEFNGQNLWPKPGLCSLM